MIFKSELYYINDYTIYTKSLNENSYLSSDLIYFFNFSKLSNLYFYIIKLFFFFEKYIYIILFFLKNIYNIKKNKKIKNEFQ